MGIDGISLVLKPDYAGEYTAALVQMPYIDHERARVRLEALGPANPASQINIPQDGSFVLVFSGVSPEFKQKVLDRIVADSVTQGWRYPFKTEFELLEIVKKYI